MATLYKIGFGIALVGVMIIVLIKWMFPVLSLWIVFSPLLALTVLILLAWCIETFYKVFRILIRLSAFLLVIYLFWKLFL